MPLSLTAEDVSRYLHDHQAPAPHLDLLPAAALRVVVTAIRLGVFDALARRPLSLTDLAAGLDVDRQALSLVIAPLTTFGYLRTVGENISTTPYSDPWLLTDHPRAFSDGLVFWQAVLDDLWSDLERTIRTGAPVADFYRWLEQRPTLRSQFQAMLAATAEAWANEVSALVDIPDGPARLLDVGGSHARYSAAFCKRRPELSATIVDFPGALETGAEFVATTGLADRITLRPANFLTDDLGWGFDAALLFNILHGFSPESSKRLLSSIARAVVPGGRVAIMESLRGSGPAQGTVAAAFVEIQSLNLFHGQGGRVHRAEDIAGWLAEVGFAAPTVTAVPGSTTHSLFVATRSTP